MNFLIRLIVTAVALWAAVYFVPGIEHTGPLVHLLGVALIFGLVNAVIRPILLSLTCPLVLLTLGLFVFVLNALMLWLTGVLAGEFGIAFRVDGFIPALIGGLVVGIVSTVLNIVAGAERKK
jgi:putative membrane protein